MSALLLAASLMLAPAAVAPGVGPHPERINCPDHPYWQGLGVRPRTPGPLKIRAIYCQVRRSTPFPVSDPIISPDGRWIAYHREPGSLFISRLADRDAWSEQAVDVGVFAQTEVGGRGAPTYRWAADSRFVWAATQARQRPAGWALGPMRPAAVSTAGVRALPRLTHPAGTLDALLFADGEGRALAQFGTRGRYYRPERPNPDPALAIIDTRSGAILDTLRFHDFASLSRPLLLDLPYLQVRNAAAVTLPDRRVRAFVRGGDWVVWTQGAKPRVLPDPYGRESDLRTLMTPDGSRLLVIRQLTPDYACARLTGCVYGPPVTGRLAALHDLKDGRALWSIEATATAGSEYPAAISPDGRYALLALPQTAGGAQDVALVSMQTGKVVQTLRAEPGTYPLAVGFVRNGRTAWTHMLGTTTLYDLE